MKLSLRRATIASLAVVVAVGTSVMASSSFAGEQGTGSSSSALHRAAVQAAFRAPGTAAQAGSAAGAAGPAADRGTQARAGAGSKSGAATSAISFSPCPDLEAGSPAVECGTLAVPLDYQRPSGSSISIPVTRIKAADPAGRIGVLLINPGGPGGSGNDVLKFAGDRPGFAELQKRFDLIGFDPRGTGASDPALACLTSADLVGRFAQASARPEITAGIADALREGRDYAAACRRASGNLLPFVGTKYAAYDMDRLRAALGEKQISYLGLSYGTVLGNVYADLFPRRLRATVLDGAIDPDSWRKDPSILLGDGTVAAEAAFDRFLKWCAATADCPFGNGDPATAFNNLITAIDKPSGRTSDGEPAVNAAGLLAGVSVLLGSGTAAWPGLADALAAVAADPNSVPLETVLNAVLPIAAANVSVECTDFTGTVTPRSFTRYARRISTEAPLFGRSITLGPPMYDNANLATCAQWPVQRAPSRHTGDYRAKGVSPVLVVGTTGDPSTPYSGALAQSKVISNARLLTFDGEGHTAFSRSACATGLILTYLADLALPAEGTVCSDDTPPVIPAK